MKLACPFCKAELLVPRAPLEQQPSFRCNACNVRVVVTNPSYLPVQLRQDYNRIVKNQLILKQLDSNL